MVYSEYTWIFVLSIIVAFFVAFGIGANDLANSFGSSVGTKAIKMWQAVIIAGFCEFLGAFFLGASVTDTVKSGVVNVSQFKNVPGLFMYGFFAAMCAAAFWDNFACYLEFPVSTTHTTIGAIMGMALVIGGGDGVTWWQSRDSFPYVRGFVVIVLAWIVSPICAFIAVSIVFLLLRWLVLRSKHSFVLSFWLLPVMVGFVMGLITGFIIQVGGKNGTWDSLSDGETAWISATVAGGTALITLVIVMPLLKKNAIKAEQRLQARIATLQSEKDIKDAAGAEEGKAKELDSDSDSKEAADSAKPNTAMPAMKGTGEYADIDPELFARACYDIDVVNEEDVVSRWSSRFANTKFSKFMMTSKWTKWLTKGLFYDVHDAVKNDKEVIKVWQNAETFDFKTERLYRYLQVFSASAMAFAHGSNDVANAMGPFAAVYYTWDNSAVPGSKTTVPAWILALGGVGIVCGLAIYGYRIMRVLGVKAVKLTNSRGFVVETCTALVVVLASRFGLPVSTTQVVCGAILSMGVWEGRNGVNWWVAVRIFAGWVITVFISCGVSALITALGVFTPNKPMTLDVYNGTQISFVTTNNQLQMLNRTGTQMNNATLLSQVATLNSSLQTQRSSAVRYTINATGLQNITWTLFNQTYIPYVVLPTNTSG